MLAEFYRCPARLDRFIASGECLRGPGYFRFGKDATCYGGLLEGDPAAEPDDDLYDALEAVDFYNALIRLPFHPQEILDNLRFERYVPAGGSGLLEKLTRGIYYNLRPFFPVAMRKHLQRIRLRDWRSLSFPTWPVDSTVENVYRRLLALSLQAAGDAETPFIWFWPDGWQGCAIMTHDVETESGKIACSQLMDMDDAFDMKSSFQIVPEKRYSVSETSLNTIRRRGFEVNIHDLNHDGSLFAERAEFLRRAARINRYANEYGARGFRSAALYRNPDWYDALNFSYDMSVPNVAHLDHQRGGCCTVMPYFIGSILELPVTTTQDYMLFHILGDYSIQLWNAQIERILQNHGLVSFIVHPDYLVSQKALATYRALLEHLSELRSRRKLWIALPGEVNTWWRQRSRLTLTGSAGNWHIEGEAKERARLAFASLDGDAISYRIAGAPSADANPDSFASGALRL